VAYSAKSDGVWVNKTDPGGTNTSNLIDAADCNRWEANQLDANTRLTTLELQTVHAVAPAPATGLSAITANGSTDDRANLQSIINYVSSTWGEGVVVLPGSTIKCNSGLTGLGRVRLVGQNKNDTVLDFSGAGSSVVAVTASGNGTFPLAHLKLKGPNGTDKLSYPTNSSTGVLWSGITSRLEHIRVESFFYAVDSTNSNSYFHTMFDCHLGYAGVCWDMNGNADHNGSSVPSEFGERMNFIDGVMFNSQVGVDVRQSGVGFFTSNSSYDYLGVHGVVDNATAKFVGCHLESGYAAVGSGTQGNWGTVNRYLFNLTFEARVSFDACRFEIRDAGVYSVVNNGSGPAVYNSGYCEFSTCHWYGQMPNAEQRIFVSREKVDWNAGDGSTKDLRSPFLSKWNSITAQACMNDGDFAPANHFFRVTAADYGTSSSGQKITLTRTLVDGASAADTWVEVTF